MYGSLILLFFASNNYLRLHSPLYLQLHLEQRVDFDRLILTVLRQLSAAAFIAGGFVQSAWHTTLHAKRYLVLRDRQPSSAASLGRRINLLLFFFFLLDHLYYWLGFPEFLFETLVLHLLLKLLLDAVAFLEDGANKFRVGLGTLVNC